MMRLPLLVSMLLFAGALPAQYTVHNELVRFAPNSSVAVYTGSLRGNSSTIYLVAARAGDTLHVGLVTSNPDARLTIYAPGADTALFDGPVTSKGVSRHLSANGDYEITVFLPGTRRRDEQADYSLTVQLGAPLKR